MRVVRVSAPAMRVPARATMGVAWWIAGFTEVFSCGPVKRAIRRASGEPQLIVAPRTIAAKSTSGCGPGDARESLATVIRIHRPPMVVVVFGHARVGHCQAFESKPPLERSGGGFSWCARQGALIWRWKSSTHPARGSVSRTARVPGAIRDLEEVVGKALA